MQAAKAARRKRQAETAPDNARLRAPRRCHSSTSQRVKIATPELEGSINLKGAGLDDLVAGQLPRKHRCRMRPKSPCCRRRVRPRRMPPIMRNSAGSRTMPPLPCPTPIPYGTHDGKQLYARPRRSILHGITGRALLFERTIAVDDHFMFTVTDSVQQYRRLRRSRFIPSASFAARAIRRRAISYILHEGPLGVLDGTLEEYKYKNLMAAGKKNEESTGGWLGITDKYWLVAHGAAGRTKNSRPNSPITGRGSNRPAQRLFPDRFPRRGRDACAGRQHRSMRRIFSPARNACACSTTMRSNTISRISIARSISAGFIF